MKEHEHVWENLVYTSGEGYSVKCACCGCVLLLGHKGYVDFISGLLRDEDLDMVRPGVFVQHV